MKMWKTGVFKNVELGELFFAPRPVCPEKQVTLPLVF